jgi:hypothetical protein
MNLTCPKCGTEDTRKLTLVMNQGGVAEKGAQLGVAYGANIMIPLMTFVIACLMGIMFALFNWFLGLLAFAGTVYGGMKVRAYLKNKTKSKYADLSPQMKADGFLCNRCEHMFIPARAAGA